MGALTSQAMLEAIKIIRAGATRYAASKATGLRISSITNSKEYKLFVAEQQSKNNQHIETGE